VIRVLHLLKGLGAGGAERLVVDHIACASAGSFGYEVAYLLPWKDALVREAEDAGATVHCLDCRKERDLRWVGRLRRLVREREVDVVHVHSPYVAAATRVALRAQRGRPRLVSTVHNLSESFRTSTRHANNWTMRLDDADFAVSESVRDSLPRRLRGRVDVVVHGVDLSAVRASLDRRVAVRHALGLADDDIVVVTVANFRATKDHATLLRAAARVKGLDPRVRFVIVGRGPQEQEVRSLHHDLELGDRALLLVGCDDAVGVIAAGDVFALSSVHEGLPVALMEALVLGRPVVATAVGGISEAVRDGGEGVLVPPRRPDLLADAIARVARDPGLRESMAAAAAIRGDQFDIRNAVYQIETRYRELVGT
jgi:glycosyltransferase involved in cell wall biosynthesis